MNQFVNELNAFLRKTNTDIYVVVNPIQRRLDFQAGGQFHLRVRPPISYIMGMKPGEWFTFTRERVAPYPMDIKAGFYHLYCYSDVVRHQLVGDTYAPLLRIADVRGTFGDIITQYFNLAYYMPVVKNHIESIHIEIKNDQNKPVNFVFGKTIVKLHFRPSKSYITSLKK